MENYQEEVFFANLAYSLSNKNKKSSNNVRNLIKDYKILFSSRDFIILKKDNKIIVPVRGTEPVFGKDV